MGAGRAGRSVSIRANPSKRLTSIKEDYFKILGARYTEAKLTAPLPANKLAQDREDISGDFTENKQRDQEAGDSIASQALKQHKSRSKKE